jgi:hypothetical protein
VVLNGVVWKFRVVIVGGVLLAVGGWRWEMLNERASDTTSGNMVGWLLIGTPLAQAEGLTGRKKSELCSKGRWFFLWLVGWI